MASDDTTGPPIFECRRCGDCCKGFGGTYLSPADVERISSFIGVSQREFLRGYCTLSGGKPIIAQAETGYCIFWDQLCTIHPVKPRMCRQWPFIRAVTIDVANWDIMADLCPGMKRGLPGDRVRSLVLRDLKRSSE